MQNPPPPANRPPMRLELVGDLVGQFSNSVMISHTSSEFVFDFIQIVPSDARARVVSRVVMTPIHAKQFLDALAENIGRYEARAGAIPVIPRPPTLADQLFNSVQSPSPEAPQSPTPAPPSPEPEG